LSGIGSIFCGTLGAACFPSGSTFNLIANAIGAAGCPIEFILGFADLFLGAAFELVGGASPSFAVKFSLGPLLHNVASFVTQSSSWGAKAKQQARANH
jgi:hypothetical protein